MESDFIDSIIRWVSIDSTHLDTKHVFLKTGKQKISLEMALIEMRSRSILKVTF